MLYMLKYVFGHILEHFFNKMLNILLVYIIIYILLASNSYAFPILNKISSKIVRNVLYMNSPNIKQTKVLFVETGFGCDQHGQSSTKAAVRACR